MVNLSLRSVVRGKPARTMVSDKVVPCPLDHVNRQFQVPRRLLSAGATAGQPMQA